MKLQQSFEVAAPIDQVWKALIDIERVAPCLPGANITERDDDGSYKGTFEVRLGPTTASYRGVLKITEADEAAHRAVLDARGTDKRGQGGATATIVNTLTETGGTTQVHADTDFTITGRLARFSRSGMIEDISNRLLREFSECLQAELAASGAAPEPEPAPAATAEAATADAPAGDDAAEAAAVATGPAAASSGGDAPPAAAASPPPRPAASPPPRPKAAPQPAKPVNGVTLMLGILYQRLARLFGRPGRKP